MNFLGIAIGIITFLIIGAFHVVVIKCEYYFSDKIWPIFLVLGLLTIVLSLLASNVLLSSILGVLGCVFLWSIRELKDQRIRVEKGWFPKNPNRK